ncbi:PLAC8 family-domain-containing protein [Melampsora americana]|nr:PLAC8 family-domain-containing protein [Melampsora americana]
MEITPIKPNPEPVENPPTYQDTKTNQPAHQVPMSVNQAQVEKTCIQRMKPETRPTRPWRHGLFKCHEECGTTCLSCWCPCMVYGRNHSRLSYIKMYHQPHPTGGDPCGPMSWLFTAVNCTFGVGWILQFLQRGEIRDRYLIEGSVIGDFCGACCCMCLQQVQESRELNEEERLMQGVPEQV